MLSRYLTKKQYFNLVAAIANLHNCRLMDIDFPRRIINIAGHRKAVNACCVELEGLFGRYKES